MPIIIASQDIEDRRLRSNINVDKKRRSPRHLQSSPHIHNYYEVFHMQSGGCRFFLQDSIYILEPGDFLVIHPGDYHLSKYDAGEQHNDRFIVYFDIKKIDPRVLPYLETIFPAVMFTILPEKKEELYRRHDEMLQLFHKKDDFSDLCLDFVFQSYLLFLSRSCTVKNRAVTESESALEQAAQYMKAHYAEEIDLETISSIAGFSPSYFSRKFKELTGSGFRDYLNHIRLQEASHMLRSSNKSILEISQECGFTSSNYFGDLFHSVFGASPREYRKADLVT